MTQPTWKDKFLLADDVRHTIGASLVILTPVKGMNQTRFLIITDGLIVYTTRASSPDIALSCARAFIDEAKHPRQLRPLERWAHAGVRAG